MGFFDPPPLTNKAFTRRHLKFPKQTRKSFFYVMYFGSVLFWIILFTSIGAIMLFIVFPWIHWGISLKASLIILGFLFFIGWFIGMIMGANLVNSFILQGIEAGDIEVVKPEPGKHNAGI